MDEIGGEIVQVVPRNPLVQQAENQGKTVVEAFPDSDMTKCYIELAKKMTQDFVGGE